jgi:thioredoxin 1
MVHQITSKEEYDSTIKDANVLVVIDFYATWCGPCRTISPKLESFAATYAGKMQAYKVDVDELDDVAEREEISAMPTFLFYKGGSRVDIVVGASESKLMATIEKHI